MARQLVAIQGRDHRIGGADPTPPGKWHYVGEVGEPPFENGWLNVGGDSPPMRFRRTNENETVIEGAVYGGADETAVFTVPVVYRPDADSPPAVGVGGNWVLQADGQVIFTAIAGDVSASRTLTAGDGLSGGGDLSADRTFTVNVDDSTIEIDTDTLQVKDAGITEAKIGLADNTTNNSSTSKHGFLKKLDNDSSHFMNGQGNWATPSGSAIIGTPELIYRYTVTGSDKASIDTGSDTADAGSNDWTNGDVLEIWMLLQGDNAATVDVAVDLTLNNDTGSNYDNQAISAVNTTVSGAGAAAQASWAFNTKGQGGSTSYPSVHRITIPGYAATTFFKVAESSTSRIDTTAANQRIDARALGYRSTSAITRAKIAARTTQKLKVGSQLLIYKRRNA